MSGGYPASPFGEGGIRRLGDLETSPDTARNTQTKATLLAELRELNQRRARLIRNFRRVYGYGPRATVELRMEFATRLDAPALLEELAAKFAGGVNPHLLRAISADNFPAPPLHVVSRNGR